MPTRLWLARYVPVLKRRASFACVAALLLGGCYARVPVASLPAPDMPLAVDLNDAGRVAMAPQIGPSVLRLEGYLASQTDSDFVMRVSSVSSIGGTVTQWSGESVTLRPAYVQAMSERRLAKGRTVALAGGVAAAVGVFIVTRGLGVLGGGSGGSTPGSPDGNPNSRWVHP